MAKPNQVRIIGGKWRGRKIIVPRSARPTPDRVRETLFNWLAPTIHDAAVLDLFAGTGALGLEALSRGARHATFIERDLDAARCIRRALETFGAGAEADVLQIDALKWLLRSPADDASLWDLIFIDPPFVHDDYAAIIAGARQHLATDGMVYVESTAEQSFPGFETVKSARAGAVYHALFRPA